MKRGFFVKFWIFTGKKKELLMEKERADKVLVARGLVESRHKAQALIMAGLVYSEGQRVEKPGQRLALDENILIKETMPFVSRGGLKLEEALDSFDISVKGQVAADLGASTGGFTDCLLQRGVVRVYAVDVDIRQLDWQLREDPRVILKEKNARYLKKTDFPEALGIVTMDLSFISVLKVMPAVKEFLGEGKLLALIKPQFEVGKGQVGRKGIVKDPRLHQEVLVEIEEEASGMGFALRDLIKISLLGQKGNQEFFAYWSLGKSPLSSAKVKRSIREVVWNE
jgi:23S rRNA (cytidine1920-2'-O)/16S rRNA (cytidine1409-2'-O)-methyltransferase